MRIFVFELLQSLKACISIGLLTHLRLMILHSTYMYIKRMLKQGADSWKILHQCKKAMDKHSHSFVKFASRSDIIIEKLLEELI